MDVGGGEGQHCRVTEALSGFFAGSGDVNGLAGEEVFSEEVATVVIGGSDSKGRFRGREGDDPLVTDLGWSGPVPALTAMSLGPRCAMSPVTLPRLKSWPTVTAALRTPTVETL
jgi:hypothetical protein